MVTISQFSRIFRTKISYGKKKRLAAIQEYFATEHNTQYEFGNDSEQCLKHIVSFVTENPNFEQNVFTDIIDLLHDRYSLGDAFIVYNVSVNQQINFEDFKKIMSDFFENTIEREMFDFDADHFIEDNIDETIKIKAKYKEYQRDLVNDSRSENINHSGQIPVYFDFQNKKVLVNTGYYKAAKSLVSSLNESIATIQLSERKVKDDVRLMPNLITTDFNPLSILSLNLILQELSKNSYIVNDILSISFNNEQAPRVKNARIGGTNLLQDSDVIHRVYRGDCITNFLLDIIHLNDNGQADLIAEVLIDFRTDLKISFFNLQIHGILTVEESCLEIERIIYTAIHDQATITNTLAQINTNLPRIQTGNEELFIRVLTDIKDNIKTLITNDDDRNAVEGYLNSTYRL